MNHRLIRHAAIAVLCLFFLQSCIFLRLARAMREFKEPEKAITFLEQDGAVMGKIKFPIIYLTDLKVLLGELPKKVKGNLYRYTFSKSGLRDRTPWHLGIWINEDKRINGFLLPKKLNQVLGKKFIVAGIKALGHSRVSVFKKKLYLKMDRPMSISQMDEIMGKALKVLGNKREYHFKQGKNVFNVLVWTFGERIKRAVMTTGKLSIEVRFK